MSWLTVVTSVAAGGLLLACEPPPTATDDVDVGALLMVGADNNGATVWRGDWGCGVSDGLGNWFPPDWPESALLCGTEVATFSPNMNAKLTVQASGVPNPTGKTVSWGPYNPGQDWADSYPDLTGPPYPCFVLGTDHDVNNPLFTVTWKALLRGLWQLRGVVAIED
jgi:hypothetical protein